MNTLSYYLPRMHNYAQVKMIALCICSNTNHRKNIYKRTNVMHLGSMFICNCNIALHVSDAFYVHLQEHLATVEAASGE